MEPDGVVSVIENRPLSPEEIGLLASLIAEERDHYTVLGVNRNATSEEIQSAYCLAVEYFHPLKNLKATESDCVMHWRLSSAFLRIEEAFAVLLRQTGSRIYGDTLGVEQVLFPKQTHVHVGPDSRQGPQGEQPAQGRPIESPARRSNESRRW